MILLGWVWGCCCAGVCASMLGVDGFTPTRWMGVFGLYGIESSGGGCPILGDTTLVVLVFQFCFILSSYKRARERESFRFV